MFANNNNNNNNIDTPKIQKSQAMTMGGML